jgi:hypothetical protein
VLLERSWWAGFNWKISWERGNTWANGTGHTSIYGSRVICRVFQLGAKNDQF